MRVDQGSRLSRRAALNRTAWLEGVKLVPCGLADISGGGAQLCIPELHPLPEEFSIALLQTGECKENVASYGEGQDA